jgi:hypothetical protein
MADEQSLDAITAISIKGFKSFFEEQRIEIRPLTLLAGANSSGKSSALQPLLLLKQTLESPVDRGPLDLSGPHLKFTSPLQMLAKSIDGTSVDRFEVAIEISNRPAFREVFKRSADDQLDLVWMDRFLIVSGRPEHLVLEPGLTTKELESRLPLLRDAAGPRQISLEVVRVRCFLGIVPEELGYPVLPLLSSLARPLRSVIHVSGLRGNPERTYRTTAIEGYFEGVFDPYSASIVADWQKSGDHRLLRLVSQLSSLGLTSSMQVRPIDATQVELLIGRSVAGMGPQDFVSLADVGFGVSQVLPVLVALLVAKPGQLVYLEQPELHLHPRAQQALATVLAEAANRGVRVVAETHSSILLLAVQTLVAEGKLSPNLGKLHWFQRDARGATRVTSADLDQLGSYGDWPEDFGEVEAKADNEYLDAVEARAFPPKKKKNARK